MGLKGFTPYLYKTKKVFHTEESLCSVLKDHEIDIIFIDFCCMFFDLLQDTPGLSTIKDAIYKKAWDTKDPEFLEAIDQLVNDILNRVRRLRMGKPRLNVCLVIDGSTMRAKSRTCKLRATEKKNQDKINFVWKIRIAIRNNMLARNDVFHYRDHIKPNHMASNNHCSMINPLLNKKPPPSPQPQQLPLCQSNSNKMKKGKVFFHVARFEADPEIVYLCNELSRSNERGAIMSGDSDLLAYPGAFDALRITKIDWEQLPMPVTVTTKAKVFAGLGFSSNKKLRQFNETKLAVLAALCGNDYAENLKNVKFNEIVQIIQKITEPMPDDPNTADTLLKIVLDKIIKEIPQAKPKSHEIQRFNIALHQFCIPQISGITFENNNSRCCFYQGLPINMDANIIDQLGREEDLLSWPEDSDDDSNTLHEDPSKVQQQRQQERQQAQNRFFILSLETQDDSSTQCQQVIFRAARTVREEEEEDKGMNSNIIESHRHHHDQETAIATTTTTLKKQVLSSSHLTTKTIVQIKLDKMVLKSLPSSSKAKLFAILLLAICYYPLLFCFFYIYLVIVMFLCMPFILSIPPMVVSTSPSS